MPSKFNSGRANSDKAGPITGGVSNLRRPGEAARVRETVVPVWSEDTVSADSGPVTETFGKGRGPGGTTVNQSGYSEAVGVIDPAPGDTPAGRPTIFVEAEPYGRDSGAKDDYRSPVEVSSQVPKDYRSPNPSGTPDRDSYVVNPGDNLSDSGPVTEPYFTEDNRATTAPADPYPLTTPFNPPVTETKRKPYERKPYKK